MSLSDLLPKLQELNRVEKLRAMQFLVTELAKEEEGQVRAPEAEYRVWTPYGNYEAGDALLAALRSEQQ